MLHKAIPLLPALNLRATIDFYETRLGFSGINRGSYAIVKKDSAEIHFYLVMTPALFQPSSCLLYTDNVEDLYTLFAEKDMLYQPGQIKDMRMGAKEFSVEDNNGNIIRFSRQPG